MSSYELIALIAGSFHLVLTVFVLSRALRSNVNLAYALWGGSLTLWNFASFAKYSASTEATADFWLRVLHLGLIFLPVSILHLSLLIARISAPRMLVALYAVYAFFAASVLTQHGYVAGIKMGGNFGPIVIGGPLFKAYFVFCLATTFSAMGFLFAKQRHLTQMDRSRVRALLVALAIFVGLGIHDLMLPLGVTYYPGTHIRFFPLGNLGAILFGIIIAYSVLQHQLLNVHVSLSRIAAQLVRILFVFLLGFTLLILVRFMVNNEELFPAFAFFCSLAVLLLSACLASYLFPRLFGKGDEALERRILGDQFEYQDKVTAFIQSIPFYTQTEGLLSELQHVLVQTMRVQRYHIILLDETKRVFSLFYSHPAQSSLTIPELTLDSPIFRLFRQAKADLLAYRIAYAVPGETALERAARQQLKQFEPEFCFPFFSGEDPFGLLLVGAKSNGEPYTFRDSQLFVRMAKNLGLILSQIQLKKQLLLAEEMELLGNMSRGMAHDLNNLLTPVSTFLQLLDEGKADPETMGEFLPTAMRNLTAMRSYVSEALFFSKTQALQLKPFGLESLIEDSVALVEAELKAKRIQTAIDVSPELVVEMDEVLVRRLIRNLLSNAIDASPADAQIRITVNRLARTQTDCEWYRLRVIDQGEGISRENLRRIGTPYFTTKDCGDQQRGFGLGLAICRKIVHLHGGHLVIASEERKGTTVQVDLPDRQKTRPGRLAAATA